MNTTEVTTPEEWREFVAVLDKIEQEDYLSELETWNTYLGIHKEYVATTEDIRRIDAKIQKIVDVPSFDVTCSLQGVTVYVPQKPSNGNPSMYLDPEEMSPSDYYRYVNECYAVFSSRMSSLQYKMTKLVELKKRRVELTNLLVLYETEIATYKRACSTPGCQLLGRPCTFFTCPDKPPYKALSGHVVDAQLAIAKEMGILSNLEEYASEKGVGVIEAIRMLKNS